MYRWQASSHSTRGRSPLSRRDSLPSRQPTSSAPISTIRWPASGRPNRIAFLGIPSLSTASVSDMTWLQRRAVSLLLACIVGVYATATVMAMRQTSTTFDEIILPAAGARGYVTGDFDLVKYYHPRIMP